MPKAKRMLTAAAVGRYRADPGGKRREISDAGMRGLSLLVLPSGTRSWIMRFRRPDGRPAKLTLGTVDLIGGESEQEPVLGGVLTLAAARKLAAEVQRQRAMGRDIVADYAADRERRKAAHAARARNVFGGAARSFVDEYARLKTRRWRETASLLGLRVGPTEELIPARGGLAERWSDMPVADITAHHIHALVDEVRRRGVPGLVRRGDGPTESRARAIFACLSKFFGWLVAHRVIETNPCVGVQRPAAPQARERVLSDDELRLLWLACEQIETFGPLIRLLLVTGQRLNEIAQMTRSELGLDDKGRSVLTLPPARTKNKRTHVVPLSPLADGIIGTVKKIAGKPGYVFTTNGATPVSGFSKAKRNIDQTMVKLARQEAIEAGRDPSAVIVVPWRVHDLRRTAVTGMARAGADLHVIERAINHVSGSFAGVVGTYQRHRFAGEVRAALEAWANMLGQITAGAPAANVIAMRKGAAE
jgi:integrase